MKDTEEVNGTEQSSSGEIAAKMQEESKKMVEKTTDAVEQEVNSDIVEEANGAIIQEEEASVEKKAPIEESVVEEEIKADLVIEESKLSEEANEVKKEKLEVKAEDDSVELNKIEETKLVEAGEISKVAPNKEEVIKPVKEEKLVKAEPNKDELADADFSKYTKSQFVDLIKLLAKHDSPMYAERQLKQIEPLFDAIRKSEVEEAKAAYLKENGNEEGFSFKADELTERFDANTRLIHDRKHVFYKDRENNRQTNLKKAEAALEHLREFVDSEESSASFNKFKEIQNEWKAIGDVPGNQSKTLWANYNALINRFYDQRSIYFELKELDRKKNYEAKSNICERAEALHEFENLKDAINTLNDLHDEYKHVGPVPRELQEDLWTRFKNASDKVYQKRKEFVSDLKVVLLENLKKKEELIESIKLFVEFDSDRIKAWNLKTKELLELQKTWESIGGLPRDKSKDINKVFWASFKTFFHNKGNFFKKLDSERKSNYEAKLVLLAKAETLKESTDWFKTTNDFKALQQEWKSIGPVPEKVRNVAYEKFKSACDFFFDNKRANSKDEEKNYKENLNLKKDIINLITEWSSEADNHIAEFKVKAKEFSSLGFVPRKDIKSIKEKFTKSVDLYLNALSTGEEEKNTIKMEIELGDILGSKNSESALYGKEQNLRKQVQHLENDVSLWKNNLEFFAHSKTKNADDLRKDVNQKIEKAEIKVAALKAQLKIIRSL